MWHNNAFSLSPSEKSRSPFIELKLVAICDEADSLEPPKAFNSKPGQNL